MDNLEKSIIDDLVSVCTSCESHHDINKNSYTSPGYIDFLGRALTVGDIPMSSYIQKEDDSPMKDPSSTPWEDSVKNLVFDMTSMDSDKRYDTCILLYEFGYKLPVITANSVSSRYGIPGNVTVDVIPEDCECEYYIVNIRRYSTLEYTFIVDSEHLVGHLIQWYVANSTLILCHDNSNSTYKDVISMMSESTWSVQCTVSTFISARHSSSVSDYICPTYTCPGSLETRCIGTGPIKYISHGLPQSYIGKLNYYLRCIRGSRHSSGRCYDCEILYRVLSTINIECNSKSTATKSVVFSPDFLKSVGDAST